MLRNDLDGILCWLTQADYDKEKPALTLDMEDDKYLVFMCTVAGERENLLTFDTVKAAVQAFANLLP